MTARSSSTSRPVRRLLPIGRPLPIRRLLLVTMAVIALAALFAPALVFGDEQAVTAPAGQPATTPEGAPSATTPTAPSTAPAESTPAPTTAPSAGAPGVSSTPQVQGQHAQGSTPSRPEDAAHAHPKSRGGKGNGSAPVTRNAPSSSKGKEGNAATGHHPAPKPSALTPQLPLTLGAPISGVSSFFIESFRIPPFLLPIYQAAGSAYGVPWQVLAAINEVETDYGRDLSISSAGAEGWMQFLPSSWAQYGVDANGDGFKDPYNPADAIFAAARYLRAAGAGQSVRGAVFSYNHSQAYVESVMLRARLLGGTPPELLGAITGLTEARFPVHAASHFSDGFPTATAPGGGAPLTLAGTTIYSTPGAPVIAVQDGQIVQIGVSPTLGKFISLRDPYGNTYTYAQLGSVAKVYPLLKSRGKTSAGSHRTQPGAADEPRPTGPASAGSHPDAGASEAGIAATGSSPAVPAPTLGTTGAGATVPPASTGIAASPTAAFSSPPAASSPPAVSSSTPPASATAPATPASPTSPDSSASPSLPVSPTAPAIAPAGASTPSGQAVVEAKPGVFRDGAVDVYLRPLHRGVRVIAGTVLGHVGAEAPSETAAEAKMLFQIRPAGRAAPLIDPKPILDGWVRLESTSVFRAKGQDPFLASAPSAGQVLLESKEQLEQQVLHDPGISIYPCGREDIETGQIDRRVLATLELLSVSGLKPTVSALKCGHSELTTSGNVSEHSTGDAVDISEVNGIPITGHQGPGSITDTTIRRLLTLQGSMKPHQIISLMSYPGIDNTLAMADHYNHIHVGFSPLYAGTASTAGAFTSAISPSQWIKLIARLGEIPDPQVGSGHSAASIPVPPPATGGSNSGRRPRGHR